MFNKKSLKCIESKRLGCYQVHRRRFFFVFQCYESFNPVNHEISIFFTGQTDRQTTDRQTDKTDCLIPLRACTRGIMKIAAALDCA